MRSLLMSILGFCCKHQPSELREQHEEEGQPDSTASAQTDRESAHAALTWQQLVKLRQASLRVSRLLRQQARPQATAAGRSCGQRRAAGAQYEALPEAC